MQFLINREDVDSREGQLEVIGFDAANIVWSGRVQSLHQHLQRVTKLQERTIIIIIISSIASK